MEQEQKGFLDSKTIIAIALVGVVWFGWQNYMATKYPPPPKPTPEQSTAVNPSPQEVLKNPVKSEPTIKIVDQTPTEKLFEYQDATWSFQVSSLGMGLKDLTLKRFTDRNNSPIQLGAGSPHAPASTYLDRNILNFNIKKASDTEFVGTAEKDGVKITKTLRVDSPNYLVHIGLVLEGDLARAKSIALLLSEDSLEGGAKTAVGKQMGGDPSLWQNFFVSHGGKTEHNATTAEKPLIQTYEQVAVAALNGKYFGQGLVDDSSIIPALRTDFDGTTKRYLGWLTYDLTGQKNVELKAKYFGGPKSLDILTTADPRLEKSVNYGMFGWLAGPLLKLMKWLYALTHNYGAAIILMTLLVRIAVMPFNIASYRSMKAMQVIQPQVNKMKEKFKDDPQAMNKEMMRLMKEHNANPLMGCLPMLLQLPVFFALYQVLDHSIELYKSPFIFWIHDLSLKDPYYVLPVLMGITMFIQQKITPTTMDPAQAKVLLMMPIVFTGLMISLPSGLTLYIFISTLFGITQQFMFMKDKRPKTSAIQAKA